VAAPESEVARLFGKGFPKKLSGLPVGQWAGPVESGYGLHLVLIQKRSAGRSPALKEVRDDVLREWKAARRQELKQAMRQKLLEKYAVAVEWPDWAGEAARVTGATGPGEPK
jgi:hypothetical protein